MISVPVVHHRIKAQFSYVGQEVDPSLITEVLGIVPTRSFKKGDPYGPTPLYRRYGSWQLESTLPKSDPLDDHIRQLLDILDGTADKILRLRHMGYEPQFYCGYFFAYEQGGQVELMPNTFARLALLGVRLVLRVYWEGDGE